MAIDFTLSRVAHSSILAHLRTLRASLAQARDALMHFSQDRVDRDKLEPAARRVDDLMNLFTGDQRDPRKGSVWVTEVLGGVEQVTNPKAEAGTPRGACGYHRVAGRDGVGDDPQAGRR